MLSNDFWWPLDLSPPEDAAVRGFYRLVAENPPPLDLPLLMGSVDLLAALMTRHVCDIIDRDGLPHLCHVINGWGNAVCRGQRLWDRMAAFIHRDEQGRPAILQRDPEGEYHPWQSFAYAVMAGVGPDDPIPPDGVTLRTLSQNSRILNTQAGHELGHLLFALAYLDPALEGPPFALLDAEASASDLVDAAIEAHHRGSFEVCRKFHLTEGVCAMAALVPSLRHHRRTAQGFLDGQMDILFVLGTILWEVRRAADSAQSPPPDGLLEKLRESLIIGNFFENHVYYAGHLIELGMFAAAQGYCLTPAHRGAMAYIVNELNRTLPAFTESLSFTDCFLHFGHFRRAITLLAASEGARWGRDAIGQLELRSYTVDFDNFRGAEYTAGPSSGPVNPALQTLYALETPKGKARTRFLAVVGKYAEAAQRGLEPRGKFDHFRRIGPPTWPRAIHYELLDYGDRIGVEIHLESDAVLPLRLFLIDFRDRLSGLFLPLGVEWDPGWWKRRGRLRILYGDEVPPADVARGMQILIDMTYPLLNSVASTLVSSPNRSFHFGEERRTSLING